MYFPFDVKYALRDWVCIHVKIFEWVNSLNHNSNMWLWPCRFHYASHCCTSSMTVATGTGIASVLFFALLLPVFARCLAGWLPLENLEVFRPCALAVSSRGREDGLTSPPIHRTTGDGHSFALRPPLRRRGAAQTLAMEKGNREKKNSKKEKIERNERN